MEDAKDTHHTVLTLAEHCLNFISALLVRDKFGPEGRRFEVVNITHFGDCKYLT